MISRVCNKAAALRYAIDELDASWLASLLPRQSAQYMRSLAVLMENEREERALCAYIAIYSALITEFH